MLFYSVYCVIPNFYYMEQTQNTVSVRLTGHLQNNVIKERITIKHYTNLTRENWKRIFKLLRKLYAPKNW